MNSNIILIGFMGSGKTTIGRQVAKRVNFEFIDIDEQIVKKSKKTIADIFRDQGEWAFRTKEREELLSLTSRQKIILSTGAGIVMEPENVPLLKSLGLLVWLHADPDILFERAMRSRKRPLLATDNPRHIFDHLLIKRIAIYRDLADLTLDVSHSSYMETVNSVIHIIYSYFN
jgi:shikimate kinase